MTSPPSSSTGSTVGAHGRESSWSDHRDRWVAELEKLERVLTIQEQLLTEGDLIEIDISQALFEPSAGMDHLPVDLVARATKLAERIDDLVRLAGDLATDVPLPLRSK